MDVSARRERQCYLGAGLLVALAAPLIADSVLAQQEYNERKESRNTAAVRTYHGLTAAAARVGERLNSEFGPARLDQESAARVSSRDVAFREYRAVLDRTEEFCADPAHAREIDAYESTRWGPSALGFETPLAGTGALGGSAIGTYLFVLAGIMWSRNGRRNRTPPLVAEAARSA